jgi:hypothetical protein
MADGGELQTGTTMATVTIGGRNYEVEVRGASVVVDGREYPVKVRDEGGYLQVTAAGIPYRVQLRPRRAPERHGRHRRLSPLYP